jgi:hypothetical protein
MILTLPGSDRAFITLMNAFIFALSNISLVGNIAIY